MWCARTKLQRAAAVASLTARTAACGGCGRSLCLAGLLALEVGYLRSTPLAVLIRSPLPFSRLLRGLLFQPPLLLAPRLCLTIACHYAACLPWHSAARFLSCLQAAVSTRRRRRALDTDTAQIREPLRLLSRARDSTHSACRPSILRRTQTQEVQRSWTALLCTVLRVASKL